MGKIEQKKYIAEQIWLEYFNRMLFDRQFISEADRNKLVLKIENRKLPVKTK